MKQPKNARLDDSFEADDDDEEQQGGEDSDLNDLDFDFGEQIKKTKLDMNKEVEKEQLAQRKKEAEEEQRKQKAQEDERAKAIEEANKKKLKEEELKRQAEASRKVEEARVNMMVEERVRKEKEAKDLQLKEEEEAIKRDMRNRLEMENRNKSNSIAPKEDSRALSNDFNDFFGGLDKKKVDDDSFKQKSVSGFLGGKNQNFDVSGIGNNNPMYQSSKAER